MTSMTTNSDIRNFCYAKYSIDWWKQDRINRKKEACKILDALKLVMNTFTGFDAPILPKFPLPPCEWCGKHLVIRKPKKETNKKGCFFACSDYPNCKFILSPSQL